MSSPAAESARVGLFGGSFDPVHAGHLHAARAALEAFGLELVAFVPARQPPHKPGRVLASGDDRLRMLRLATGGEPRFLVLPLELEREGPSFTIDTVRALPAALGRAPDLPIYLVLGSDNLAGLESWREASALIERVHPVVVHRGDEPREALDRIERVLGRPAADKIRAGYLRPLPVPVSSTHIRARLSGGASTDSRQEELELPASVLEYIREHGLYGVGR